MSYKSKHKSFVEVENVCLHLNPRFSDNVVVRNSMTDGKWDKEEVDSNVPFGKGQEFKLQIESTEDVFHISVNDKKFTSFR